METTYHVNAIVFKVCIKLLKLQNVQIAKLLAIL